MRSPRTATQLPVWQFVGFSRCDGDVFACEPLIREAINMDGAILFDASLGTFGGGTERVGMGENNPTAFKFGGM